MALTTTDTGATRVELVTATFQDRESAERAFQALLDRGYTRDDVNVLMTDDARKRHYPGDTAVTSHAGSKAAEGGLTGAALGGTAGAVAGALLATAGAIAIPGLGLVIAGPIAAALAGLGAGGAAGGLIGALIGAGIPEERAKVYEQDLREGRIVMGVRPRTASDADMIEREWRANRGVNVHK